MWAETKFAYLYLPNARMNVVAHGELETVAVYSVVFDVTWDDEHGTRAIKFRNRREVRFGLTGDDC